MSAAAIESIKAAMADRYGVTVAALESESRRKEISRARQAAMWVCRRAAGATTLEIGDRFGGRDHTTVVYACKEVEARLARGEERGATLAVLAAVSGRRPPPDHEVALALSEARRAREEIAALKDRLCRAERALERLQGARREGSPLPPIRLAKPDPWPADIGGRFDA